MLRVIVDKTSSRLSIALSRSTLIIAISLPVGPVRSGPVRSGFHHGHQRDRVRGRLNMYIEEQLMFALASFPGPDSREPGNEANVCSKLQVQQQRIRYWRQLYSDQSEMTEFLSTLKGIIKL